MINFEVFRENERNHIENLERNIENNPNFNENHILEVNEILYFDVDKLLVIENDESMKIMTNLNCLEFLEYLTLLRMT